MILDGFPALAALVEQRLEQAAARGELSNLPGAGRPLELDDDLLVPEDMRVACRVLKSAGVVPAEVAELAEVRRLIALAAGSEAGCDDCAHRRLQALLIRLDATGRHATASRAWQDYESAVLRRLARGDAL